MILVNELDERCLKIICQAARAPRRKKLPTLQEFDKLVTGVHGRVAREQSPGMQRVQCYQGKLERAQTRSPSILVTVGVYQKGP